MNVKWIESYPTLAALDHWTKIYNSNLKFVRADKHRRDKNKPLTNVNSVVWPFTSHEWPRENFSLKYQYNIKHRSDENKVKYQLRNYYSIQY